MIILNFNRIAYIFITIYFIMLCVFTSISISNEIDIRYVKSESLNVYSRMSSDSEVVKELIKGDVIIVEFEISAGEGDWCGIKEDHKAMMLGYVQCQHLDRAVSPKKPLHISKTQHPTQSRFLNELNKNSYPSIPAPVFAPVLRWDFSDQQIYKYTFEQKGIFQVDSNLRNIEVKEMDNDYGDASEFYTSSKLLVKSQSNKTANVIFQDMNTTITAKVGQEEELLKIKAQKLPPIVIQGMKEDGTTRISISPYEHSIQFLFTLPPEPLEIGESVDVPTSILFNAFGSLLEIKGSLHITLLEYVMIGNHKCAKLESVIDISQFSIPPEIKERYNGYYKGISVLYFDIENRYFVNGTIAWLAHMGVEKVPMPFTELDGTNIKDVIPEIPEKMSMSMTNDTLIRIKLVE